MLDNYIRADSIVDCVSDAKIAVILDNMMVKVRDRLDREMPDEVGIIWKVIAEPICSRVELFAADYLEPGIRDVIDDAVMRAGAEGEDPHLTDLVDLDDANGRELGEKLAEECHIKRVAFFRGLLDGMTPEALTDLQAEIVRR